MTSWLERQASSHQVQLAATAVFSGIAIAGLIYGSQAIQRRAAVDELKASIPDLDESHHADLVGRTIFLFIEQGATYLRLTCIVKLPDFGTQSQIARSSNEDIKAATLARRAQRGEYDEGSS